MRVFFVVTAAGTLPYLTLKLHWLSGGNSGVRSSVDMHSQALMIANLVSMVLDGVVILLAWALCGSVRTRIVRLLAPLVWAATGLMATPVLTYLAVLVTRPALVGSGDLDPWVYGVVYGSFAAQASGLLAFLVVRMQHPRTRPGVRVSRLLVALFAVSVSAGHFARAVGLQLFSDTPTLLDPVARLGAAVTGTLALGAAVSTPMMSTSSSKGWVVLAWVSSGAMACFSAYLLLIVVLNSGSPRDYVALLIVTFLGGSVAAVGVRREFTSRLVADNAS